MAHLSHRLSNSFQGALAGGGDPASSPLYVFGPFMSFMIAAGATQVCFGTSVWLVVFTVAMVTAMYRQVMIWVTDGTGGSGLSEEEFGGWAVKVNAGITFVEYTLTFLVSMAALVTLVADRIPALDGQLLYLQYRTLLAVGLSVLTGWLVNRGPKTAARAFGPATLGVLGLLWVMMIAAIWKLGFHLPDFRFRAFTGSFVSITFAGYSRLLALMTGVEVFANLVAAYDGSPRDKSRRAFGSLLIVMGTTCATLLIVGPAILRVSDPSNSQVSVFTQTMDKLLPTPLPYLGTLIGIIVLASASAASAQGLQNLALGLRYRHYVPAVFGRRNQFDVAAVPVWIEVGIATVCYFLLGTNEETYLALYAAGVFVLLSMTGWAAAKRIARELQRDSSTTKVAGLVGTVIAALLTSFATMVVFVERFTEGLWAYFIFIPLLFILFTYFRKRLGQPVPLAEHLGRLYVGQYLLPFEREGRVEKEKLFEDVAVPLDGSSQAEAAIPIADLLCRSFGSCLTFIAVDRNGTSSSIQPHQVEAREHSSVSDEGISHYVQKVSDQAGRTGLKTDFVTSTGSPGEMVPLLARDLGADLVVMTTYGSTAVERLFVSSVTDQVIVGSRSPLILIRPTEEWQSRRTSFERLLVNLDGSQSAERLLRYARTLARKFQSEIILLAVPENDSEEVRLRDYLSKVRAALVRNNFRVRELVTGSGPSRTIMAVSESENVDLIMVGSQGRGSIKRARQLGSVADRVIQVAQRPVFLLPFVR